VTSEQPKNARALNALNYEQRLNHPRRCSARRQRDGKPCGRFAIRGGAVCGLHGGASPQAQRKAKERMGFAKAIMLERAVRGIAPAADVPAADKRLARAVAKQQGKPGPARRATRPAGPPAPPKTAAPARQEHAETQPERAVGLAKPTERPANLPPPFAEPTEPPSRGLSTLEDAVADVATANRRAGVTRTRRRRR
jgi:hypothetical protein